MIEDDDSEEFITIDEITKFYSEKDNKKVSEEDDEKDEPKKLPPLNFEIPLKI